jgi:glycine/D-amino acid oxidase-like deaminating enzyme
MRADILIVGQGLAGTMLAWEFERAGISFAIADGGHANAATTAAAGIVNPITGRRLVKSWRVDALLPAARTVYREIEAAVGVRLWHEMRVRRLFADERERGVFREKQARGELAPFTADADDAGFWIRDAARVDHVALIEATRNSWRMSGRWREAVVDFAAEAERYDLVVDCRGVAGARAEEFGFVPWEFSKGEVLEIAVNGLESDVVLNRRHWIVPVSPGIAWVGATHEPAVIDSQPTERARTALTAGARGILDEDWSFAVVGQRAGVRVNLPDKHPVAGRHPERRNCGLSNGLGAKGALWAPMLARQWVII